MQPRKGGKSRHARNRPPNHQQSPQLLAPPPFSRNPQRACLRLLQLCLRCSFSRGKRNGKERQGTHARKDEEASLRRGLVEWGLRSFAGTASQGRDHACRPPLPSSIGDSLWFHLTFCSQSCTPPDPSTPRHVPLSLMPALSSQAGVVDNIQNPNRSPHHNLQIKTIKIWVNTTKVILQQGCVVVACRQRLHYCSFRSLRGTRQT